MERRVRGQLAGLFQVGADSIGPLHPTTSGRPIIPSRVTVSGGYLVLTADDADFGGKSYTSGKVESKWAQQFGRWEVRAKLPGTKGTWPAIWLLPEVRRYPWPSQGEIDIMEHRGDKPTLTTSAFHWGPNPRGRKFLMDKHELAFNGRPVDFTDSFHTYAVRVGRPEASVLRRRCPPLYGSTTQIPTVFLSGQSAPAEVLLNVAVGGDYVDDAQPDETSVWPQRMLVDYVRVYVREATTKKNVSVGYLEKN